MRLQGKVSALDNQMYLCVETQTVYRLSELQEVARSQYNELEIDDETFDEWFGNVLADYEFYKEAECTF